MAAFTNQTQRVADVHQFDGHIACDSASGLEIVVPVCAPGNVKLPCSILTAQSSIVSTKKTKGLELLVKSFENYPI